jgi:hypothetical protein
MVLLALQYAIFFVVVVCGSVSHVPSVNFMLLGDWGLPGYNQSLIAAQMATWADANQAQFVVALGDNFYCKFVCSIQAKMTNLTLVTVHR